MNDIEKKRMSKKITPHCEIVARLTVYYRSRTETRISITQRACSSHIVRRHLRERVYRARENARRQIILFFLLS